MTARVKVKSNRWLFQVMPGLERLRHYKLFWLRGDLLAGVTVAAYLIPQCMAYGELAGVGPVQGLWAILPPMLIYGLFGSSPQLSVGPESTTAIMTAAAVAPFAMASGASYTLLAALLACLVGGVCLVGYVARLGFLTNLLSKPILIGYMTGVAIIMMAGQLGKIGGLTIESDSVFSQIQEFLSQLNQIHGPTLTLSLLMLTFLFVVQRHYPKAPGPLLAVLLATLATWLLHLDQRGVAVVGNIPAGLPHLVIPNGLSSAVLPLLSSAIGIAIVGYSDNVLTARAFASRHHYRVDANQELLALGVANLGAGLMQGFPVSSSGSRTVMGDALGSKTQLFSVVGFGVVVCVLLFFRPVLALFPKAALGAIVIFAATKLIEVKEFQRLKKFRRTELALALSTTMGVLFTNILVGVAVAVGLSVIDLLARVVKPHDAVLGEVPGVPGLHDIEDWPGAQTRPGLVLYRYDAPLCFANVENFKRRALDAIAAEATPVEWFVLDTEAIAEIDITAVDMLRDLQTELAIQGITLGLTRVRQNLYAQLAKSGLLEQIGPQHIFLTLHTAIDGFENRHQPPMTWVPPNQASTNAG